MKKEEILIKDNLLQKEQFAKFSEKRFRNCQIENTEEKNSKNPLFCLIILLESFFVLPSPNPLYIFK